MLSCHLLLLFLSHYYAHIFLFIYRSLVLLLGPPCKVDRSIPPKGLLLVRHEPSSVNTAPGPHSRGSTLRAFSVGDKEVDLLLPGTARYWICSLFFLFKLIERTIPIVVLQVLVLLNLFYSNVHVII